MVAQPLQLCDATPVTSIGAAHFVVAGRGEQLNANAHSGRYMECKGRSDYKETPVPIEQGVVYPSFFSAIAGKKRSADQSLEDGKSNSKKFRQGPHALTPSDEKFSRATELFLKLKGSSIGR